MAHKNRKKVKKFHFLKCWIFSILRLKASPVAWASFKEAFGISKLKFLIKEENPEPDPDSLEMLDPQHCVESTGTITKLAHFY
jgi:hypothetical protein